MLELETILILVCEALETTPKLVKSRFRHGILPDARSLTVFFAQKHGHGYCAIAKMLMFKRAPVLPYHVNRTNELLPRDAVFRKRYAACAEKIESYKNRHCK